MKYLVKIGFTLQILFLIFGLNRHMPETLPVYAIDANRLQQTDVLLAPHLPLLTGILPVQLALQNQTPSFKVPESQNHYNQSVVIKKLLKLSASSYLRPSFSEACNKLISKLQIRAIIYPFNYFW